MAKVDKLHSITANRLLTGEVVYLSSGFKWVTDIADAALYVCNEYASDGLAIAKLGIVEDPVRDPHLFDVTENTNRISPRCA